MNIYSVIDISTFIWDEVDFDSNPKKYYHLAVNAVDLFSAITEYKSFVILRQELRNEIFSYFPFGKIPIGISDFEEFTLNFLGDLGEKMINYAVNNSNILSLPDQVKSYYTTTTKNEIRYLINKIHLDNSFEIAFFTFSQIWTNSTPLNTKFSNQTKVHTTIIADNKTLLTTYFKKCKPVFEHHKKHNRSKPWKNASPLSCFDGTNNSIPQDILDQSIKVGKRFYGYDDGNNVYVVFYLHVENKFHGHDLKSSSVPEIVKRHFHKE